MARRCPAPDDRLRGGRAPECPPPGRADPGRRHRRLTVKGVTRDLTAPVTLTTFLADKLGARVNDPKVKGDLLVLRTNFAINRSDFGLKAGQMGDKVAETIELSLSIAGAAPGPERRGGTAGARAAGAGVSAYWLQQQEAGGHDQRRRQRAQGEAERTDAVGEESLEDVLAGGIRRVGDHRQPAARHRPGHDRVFQFVGEARHERREIGDRCVVVEGGQDRGADKEQCSPRLFNTGSIHQAWSPPCTTSPARKKPTSSGALRSSRPWWCAVAWEKARKNRKPPMEERRVMRHEHRETHEGELDRGDPAGHGRVGVLGGGRAGQGPIPLHHDEFTAGKAIIERG